MTYLYRFTPEMVRYLQVIERSRVEVGLTVLPPALAEGLRIRARVRSTHFSTRIEGNRLTLIEAEQVIIENRAFPGRERDTLEVKHYFQALEQIESWVEDNAPIAEDRIRKLHAIVFSGKRSRPTPYRDGQNVIRDSNGGIVYLPPEAKDVSPLMAELIGWIQAGEKDLPIPVVAGMAHYQFVTIHPFFDGNGRAGRALATWILYRSGYDLGRYYALEEFYSQDLLGYYDALITNPHHNYYDGRATADVTTWLVYFLKGMADVFETVAQEVRNQATQVNETEDRLIRKLDRRERIVLGLFSKQDEITSNNVAQVLGLSSRQSRALLNMWVGKGWLEISKEARKVRSFRLSAEYRRLVGGITALN